MKVYKNAWFDRFARKQDISDTALRDAITRADNGLIAADLGGGVIKQRVARRGQGQSGGFRTLVLYQAKERAVFVYGFAKSDRDNIDAEELSAFRQAAAQVLALSETQLAQLVERGQFVEVNPMAKDKDMIHDKVQAYRVERSYRSEALASIHETMLALHDIGAIGKQTLREFDASCLAPIEPMTPQRIRALREREKLSQPVFALYMNVTRNLVSDWERGVKKPGGAALRLLTLIEKQGIEVLN
ncbi:MAG: type II toxin-antitoxin system RelE/ParE family toxin [Pseudomonadales bacterium]|jgi:DNA-binding transcriptional regulator YiaG|nr:type II toxin-antitoxin system RelE/ParE family toxin [Pseudomonadales bacterium]